MENYDLSEYDYELPEVLVAQAPVSPREYSRLLVLNRDSGNISHHVFKDLGGFFSENDVIVINNTKVIPGRLYGHKDTGGKVEVLIVDFADGRKQENGFIGKCLVKASKGPKPGAIILFDKDLKAEVMEGREGVYILKFVCKDNFEDILYRIGKMPLPPYIKRGMDKCPVVDDRTSYQTVYASEKGAVAAPTAGLHFSHNLLKTLKAGGVKTAEITLHVGYGTFLPVRVSDIRDHRMHPERYTISEKAANIITKARNNGGRIIAVGTTCVRTLEYAADIDGNIKSCTGECDLFIYPGYRFKAVEAMITNFHLPQSTLLMLVSAFAGRGNILAAYHEAIRQKYRFYSYGDAMFIG